MPKTERIEIRVTRSQRACIESNAHANGYLSISSYLRDRGMDIFWNEKRNHAADDQKTLMDFANLRA